MAFNAPGMVGSTRAAASSLAVSSPTLCRSVQLGTFRFVSPTIGWALGSCDSRFSILRTVDGGQNWRSVLSPDRRTVQAGGEGVVFLDATHIWVAGQADRVRDAVTWTTDGGRTWLRTLIRVAWGPPPYYAPEFADLTFVNQQDGWLATRYAGMHEEISRLYHTTDGGLHWKAVAAALGISGVIGFATPLVGFGANSQGGGAPPIVYYSSNAGRTWRPHALPLPAIYRHVHVTMSFGRLQLSGLRRMTLPTVINPLDPGSHASLVVFNSDDQGEHWIGGAAVNLGQSGNEMTVAFANVSDGWAIALSGMYQTTDAGRSWRKIVTALKLHQGTTLDFVNALVGFALVPEQHGQILLRTDDGGHTWRRIM